MGVGAAVALVALAAAIGCAALRAAGYRTASAWEALALGAGLGLGALSYLAYGLGMAGALRPTALRAALVVAIVAAAGAWALVRRRPLPRGAASTEPASVTSIPTWCWLALAAAAVAFAAALLASMRPMVDYDGLAYHVAAPERWIELGGMGALPTHLQAEWPMGFEMLYMLLLPAAGPDAAKPLVALTGLLTALAAYCLGRRLAGPTVGVLAAALFLLLAGTDKFVTTSIEAPYALFVTLAALALAAASQARGAHENAQRRRWLALASILAGLANCVKLNGLICALLLGAAVFALPRPAGTTTRARLGEAALFVLAAVLVAAPWYARTWRDTGSPFYPFAYALLGGRDWNVHAAAVLQSYFHYFDLPGDTLAARHAVVVRHLVKFGLLLAVGLALPAPRWMRGVVLLTGAFALLQIGSSDQWRFLLPGLPFAALAGAWWVTQAAGRWRAAGWAAGAVCVALAVPAARAGIAAGRDMAADAAHGVSREAVVRRYLNIYDACLWANGHLPTDARVLVGPDSRTYYLERDAFWSEAITQQQIRYDTPEAFDRSLLRARIGYLLLNRTLFDVPEFQFEVRVGWRADEAKRLKELAARSTLLWSGDGAELYRVAPDR